MTGFWEYRHEQEQLGKANGVQPFSTKAYYAGVSCVDRSLESWADQNFSLFIFANHLPYNISLLL